MRTRVVQSGLEYSLSSSDQIRPPQCSFESRIIHASNRFHLALDMWAWRNSQSALWTVYRDLSSTLHFKTLDCQETALVLGLLKYHQPPHRPLIALKCNDICKQNWFSAKLQPDRAEPVVTWDLQYCIVVFRWKMNPCIQTGRRESFCFSRLIYSFIVEL